MGIKSSCCKQHSNLAVTEITNKRPIDYLVDDDIQETPEIDLSNKVPSIFITPNVLPNDMSKTSIF